ncbi:MAG: hypothetical protein NZ940_02755 [Candidatus Nezhaarchaeota archaeon]|nr:hypothetical protein [Candidatus Nezhaarchaeota archaeon]
MSESKRSAEKKSEESGREEVKDEDILKEWSKRVMKEAKRRERMFA